MALRTVGKEKGSVDLDGVLCVFLPAFLEVVNETYGMTLKEQDIVQYDFTKIGLKKDQISAALDNMIEKKMYQQLPIYEGAFAAIPALFSSYDLMIISSRPNNSFNQTQQWIQHNFPQRFSAVVFDNKKNEVCKNYHCRFHIDDCAEQINSLENTNTLPLLFNAGYNRDYSTNLLYHDTVIQEALAYHLLHNGWPSIRVSSWEECQSLLQAFPVYSS